MADLVQKNVIGMLHRPDGSLWDFARISFEQQATAAENVDANFIVPKGIVQTRTDGAGEFSVNLYAIAAGSLSYVCRFPNGETFEFDLLGAAPSPVDLSDLYA